jgi:hypothetical protein
LKESAAATNFYMKPAPEWAGFFVPGPVAAAGNGFRRLKLSAAKEAKMQRKRASEKI